MTTVERTGKSPLQFDGELFVDASGQYVASKERSRWYRIRLYQVKGGKWVAVVRYQTNWEGEQDFSDALIFDKPGDVATGLKEYVFPNIGSIGFPAGQQVSERQARLMADLETAWKTLVTQVLAKLPGAAETIE